MPTVTASPPPEVLDLFVVPDDVAPLPGSQGGSVRAGDLVLSPGRDAATAAWLSPLLARLAVALDEDPARSARDLRIAVPVPARDGSWVVQGWGASRYEPGTTTCRDLDVTLAAGRLLHARLAVAVRERPEGLDGRDGGGDRWARAERLVFGPVGPLLEAVAASPAAEPLLAAVAGLGATPLGPDQLVHTDLAGHVLLDAGGAPVVIDVVPAWRPVRWAEAVAVLDSVTQLGAPLDVLAQRDAVERQALLRAVLYRGLGLTDAADGRLGVDPDRYAEVVALLASR